MLQISFFLFTFAKIFNSRYAEPFGTQRPENNAYLYRCNEQQHTEYYKPVRQIMK